MTVVADNADGVWLEQIRDEPLKNAQDLADSQLDFTVCRVPDISREISPDYYERKELQLGLYGRTFQACGTQLLKIDLARALHARLSKTGGSWEAFARDVVGEVKTARKHYQNGASLGVSDEVVQYLLALDALFLVVYFQFMNNKDYFLKEFEELESRFAYTAKCLIRSDLLLLENQVPMYLLKNVIIQLIVATGEDNSVEMELDTILKVAVNHLYPFRHPECEIGWSCGLRRLRRHEEYKIERFYEYLDEKYPLDSKLNSLQNCKHVLDCVYVVVCGHSVPFQVEEEPGSTVDSKPSASRLKICGVSLPFRDEEAGWCPSALESIPSAARLKAMGIKMTDTASVLSEIKLRGCAYVTSAKLRLPKVDVYDFTETVFHNLALHEQLVENGRRGDLRCFLQCMASLSNDLADLGLLLDRGVIDSRVGNNILGMWDRIMRGVHTPLPSESWQRCYEDIHNHRNNRVKRWRREAWVLFFSKPWTFVGLMGAVAILFLTAMQTWFTVVNSNTRRWSWPRG